MENQLTALEQKIDALLASAESQSASEPDDQNEMQTGEKDKSDEK